MAEFQAAFVDVVPGNSLTVPAVVGSRRGIDDSIGGGSTVSRVSRFAAEVRATKPGLRAAVARP